MLTSSTSALSINNLSASYAQQQERAIDSVTVNFEAGQLWAIIGPNGAGKSTLLKAALGLIKPDTGSVNFFGGSLNENRQKIAYVSQHQNIDTDYPISVHGVVEMALYSKLGLLKRFSKDDKKTINEALKTVELTELSKRQIGSLSGGQMQRTFIARALAQPDADIFILDEPFAGVDIATERLIINILKELSQSGKTIIAVHHDLSTVRDYFTHCCLLNRSAIASGHVEEVFTPDNINRTYGKPLTIDTPSNVLEHG